MPSFAKTLLVVSLPRTISAKLLRSDKMILYCTIPQPNSLVGFQADVQSSDVHIKIFPFTFPWLLTYYILIPGVM